MFGILNILCRVILPTILISLANNAHGQNSIDLDSMLDQAQRLESPIASRYICKPEHEISTPKSGSNVDMLVEVLRICIVDAATLKTKKPITIQSKSKASENGSSLQNPSLVLVARMTSARNDGSLDILEARTMFQLAWRGQNFKGLESVETLFNSGFSTALAPRLSRKFVTAYPLAKLKYQSDASLALVHPSKRGIISIPLGLMRDLVPKEILEVLENSSKKTESPNAGEGTNDTSPGLSVNSDPDQPFNTEEPVRQNADKGEEDNKSEDPGQSHMEPAQENVEVSQTNGLSDLDGYPISRKKFGGSVTRIDQYSTNVDPVFLRQDHSELIDGDNTDGHRYHIDELDRPAQFVHTFGNEGTAQITAVKISAGRTYAFQYHPEKMSIWASSSGPKGPWISVAENLSLNGDERHHVFQFDRPVTANAIRLDIFAQAQSNRYRGSFNFPLYEFEILEAPETDAYTSVLRGVIINALDPAYEGHAVAFTSQAASATTVVTKNITGLLQDPVETYWQQGTAQFPQELLFAFRGHDLQKISQISVDLHTNEDIGPDWSPVVRVETSADPSPLRGFSDVGYMVADNREKRLTLELPESQLVRYVKLIIVDPGIQPYGIKQVSILGTVLNWLQADSVSSRKLLESETSVDLENEPNNSTEEAFFLEENSIVTGRSNSQGDVDFFRVNITGTKPSTLNFFIEGKPKLKSNVELLDAAGVTLSKSAASGAQTQNRFTWTLEPGSYFISLSQDDATIALAIDNSGSMGPAIYDVLDAAEAFANSKNSAEKIALYSFFASVEQLLPPTSDAARIKETIEKWRSDPGAGQAGGTSIYDALLALENDLKDVGGNKAIVVLSDGSDTTSSINLEEFWPKLAHFRTPIFTIAYGPDMFDFPYNIGSTVRDGLRSIALATEGAFFDAPTGKALPKVYAEIAEKIRERSGYRIHYEIAPATGELEVLETGGEMVSSEAVGKALIILDASGSMKAKTDAGRQRINVARTVLFDLLEEVPEQVPLGLHLYGHSKPSKPKDASCKDSELIVAPSANNRGAIKKVVKTIRPSGQTPIGYSLALAGSELADQQNSLVILLTDGEETCDAEPGAPYNPEKVVHSLLDQGVDLRVNIVGFDVTDPQVQAELARVAQSTGGEFFYGEGQKGLRTALQSAFTAPIDIIDDTDRVVASGKVGDGAITLPEGIYRIRLSGSDFISDRQTVTRDLATRVQLSKEADAVRVKVEQVALNAPYSFPQNGKQKTNSKPQKDMFNPNKRMPETMEELIYKTQFLLAELGYDPGPQDGAMGGKTRDAIEQFLIFNGPIAVGPALDVQGRPTALLWLELSNVLTASTRN